MKETSLRVVLGVYPADEGSPEAAYRTIREAGAGRVCLFQPSGTTESRSKPGSREFCKHYASIRLDGEAMVVAQAAPENVPAIVQGLRAAGSAAVFVLSDREAILSTEIPSQPEQRLRLRLRETERKFDRACRNLEEAVRLDHALTAAGEWLLDNAYLVRTQVAEIRRLLPPESRKSRSYAHLYALAQQLITATDGSLNESNISSCLHECQKTPLTMSELWLFPLLLRMALIEALTVLALRVSRSQQLREAAYLWANRLAASARMGPEIFDRMLSRMEAEKIALQPYFILSLAEQLQDEEIALAPAQRRLDQRLATTLTELVQSEHTREAADRISTANAFGSLRTLSRLDYPKIFEEVSLVEAELRSDPGGIYPHSDFTTRDQCRHVVEQISRHSGLSEPEVARRAVKLAAESDNPQSGHAAYYLLAEGVRRLEAETNTRPPLQTRLVRAIRRHSTPLYLGGVSALSVCFTALALALAWELGVRERPVLMILGALAWFPLSELSVQIVNALVISLLPPGRLPKMDFKGHIPPEHATLVVIPMMLASVEVVRREVEKLETRFLANQEANLFYSLFSDFTDSPDPVTPADAEVIQAARAGIAGLNERYPGERFLLFHRPRVWSASEQRWIGRERKRGKIEDLNALLCGKTSAVMLQVGRLAMPIRNVITLDSDTQLPAGSARRMVETIAHPLNRVEIDPGTRTRRRGYTIVQPRVSIALPDATATRFTRVFADTTGTDPYCLTVSDAQQDLFGEALFHGKAIYEVQSFCESLNHRFPAETLLSHDLIEGAHTGVGLATDIELFENLPTNYSSYCRRQHRWIRGDWQIANWILPRVPAAGGRTEPNPLTILNRWRILDNLRRSVVPIASLVLLLLGWLISAAPAVWSLVVLLALAIPAAAPLVDRWARHIEGSVSGWQGAADELRRTVVMITVLPHQAWLAVDAITRAVYRRTVSRRNLLEWETAESATTLAHRHLSATYRQLAVISGLSLLLMPVLYAKGGFAPTFLFAVLWAGSPLLVRWLDRPAPLHPRLRLDARSTLFLRRRARRTWRFFDDLVGPDSNWLPPDNSQLALRVEVAQRTSPTNIGFWLTSALAARDLGYLTADDLWRRCSQTMATLDRLERYEGHFLNWYDTRTLEPLAPRYVSTVDSGNLLACLWVLERGLHDTLAAPLIGPSGLRGLSDTVSILRDVCGRDLSMTEPVRELRRLLHGGAEGHELVSRLRLALGPAQQLRDARRWPLESSDERLYWVNSLSRELSAWTETVDRYLRWMETLTYPPDSFLEALGEDAVETRRRALQVAPSLLDLANGAPSEVDSILARRGAPELPPEISAWLDQLAAEYAEARANARKSVTNLQSLALSADRFAAAINMRFLYDARRQLFGVGYVVGGPLEFTSHYDLLASECRLASLVAIAKGDVPTEHWFALGRPRARSGKGPALLSWSGTMFEYLTPLLFMRTFGGSLLDRACHQAVEQQIEFGREEEIPWGVSESAYSALDSHQIYQYRAFGIPALALKRGLENDLVVASYATMLALLVDPEAAIQNIQELESIGLAGPMGLYESIDFTREKKREGERGVVIYTYMAHHQGMSLLALTNVLNRDVMQRRFHADLRVRAFESLLFERVPIARLPDEEIEPRHALLRKAAAEEPGERTWKEDTLVPRVHLNGNGRYTLVVTNSGGGFSRWNGFDVTRWRSDVTLDPWGSFLYIRDVRSQAVWAAAYQPLGGKLGSSSASFSADRAEFHRRVFGVETVMEVTVAPEDDVELRRVTVTNRSVRSRHLELTSYMELALAPHRADAFHPAFAKMFVETEYAGDYTVVARRRPRSPDDPPIWVAHFLTGAIAGAIEGFQYETDRAEFLGRGNTTERPEALQRDLTGSTGAVIDPIFSLRCRAILEPRDRLDIAYVTVAASSREALMELVAKYRRPEAVVRSFEMAWARAQLELRYLGIRPAAAHRFQDLAGQLLYPNPRLRPPTSRLARNRLGQSALWAYGISGDLPIVTVTVTDVRGMGLVREILLAHSYWRLRGFRADLLILNQETPSYDRPLHQQLMQQIEAHSSKADLDRPGGVFLREWNVIPEEHRNLMLATSSVVLGTTRGPLQQQLATAGESLAQPLFVAAGNVQEQPSAPLPFLELPYFNGIGGFTADGREYAIYLAPGIRTPAPWVNVMANATFGAMVSESGLGFTWSGNSQSNRLTPWHNDPVSDPQSEVIYLRDDESGAIWTPTPSPIREQDAYRARHGQGYTVFEHNSHAIGQELTVFVPVAAEGAGDPVKIYRLRLRNDSSRTRRLTVTYYADWVLGSIREEQQLHVQTSRDDESGLLLALQTWSGSTAGHIAFAGSSPRAASFSGDRTQFLGRNGSTARPAALDRVRLDNRAGSGMDPAAALQVSVNIEPGQQTDVIFLLGQAETVEGARAAAGRYASVEKIDAALATTRGFWDSILGTLQVRTPLLSTDFLLNRWLLYQALSCRFWGRSALYQSSGAMGFRDQLQDSMAFLYAAPLITRTHILTAAARQFIEGDVQHWWHPDNGMGVRTLCSDDLLWLPYAVAHYVEVTGDAAILDENVPFIDGPALGAGEHERLFVPAVSSESATISEHCRRALDHAWKLGPRGLPLIGNGDWNDGLNRVGIEGRGESVWLAWFQIDVLESFARLIERHDRAFAGICQERANKLAAAVESSCWDGEWYLRGFFDDDEPLGSHRNQEARIDSLPQSWAAISGAADPERTLRAMESAQRHLVDEPDRLVLLFTPPFNRSHPFPGYIMGYPPGVRENGGQYTHGSLWLPMAWARLGDGDKAVRLLTMMSPVEYSRTPADAARYCGEPYAVAADVSSAPGRVGRSGWTWYTGSAGWMYRIWLEEVLGFRLRGDKLMIEPNIPAEWTGFEVTYRYKSTIYEINVQRRSGVDTVEMELDGRPLDSDVIPLADDQHRHRVDVRFPIASKSDFIAAASSGRRYALQPQG